MKSKLIQLLILLVFCSVLVLPVAAVTNGRIAFGSYTDGIRVINADGTGLTRLENTGTDADAAWSLDGTKIAFSRYEDSGNVLNGMYLMNADGTGLTKISQRFNWPIWSPNGDEILFFSGYHYILKVNISSLVQTQLTDHASEDSTTPSWSPDGAKIAFGGSDLENQQSGTFVMNADGSGLTLIRPGVFRPSWSPDGTKIAYEEQIINGDLYKREIFIMNPDGSGRSQLTNAADWGDSLYRYKAWSPNGSKLAFSHYYQNYPQSRISQIYVINSDGSGQTLLSSDGDFPVWSPDGKKLAFLSSRDGENDIYVMNADGSEQTRITFGGLLYQGDVHGGISPLSWGVLPIDSGFRPNPDGYRFNNDFKEPVISWELFKDTYGADEVELENGNHSKKAEKFYNEWIKGLASGGSCFGMAATSNRIWSRNISQEQTWSLGTNRFTLLPCWTVFKDYPFLTTTTEWIENYHIRQRDVACQRDRLFLYKGSTSIYNIIKSRILNNNVYKENPLVLGIYFWDYNQNGVWTRFGHAVVPIRIVESEDQKTGRLYIYDVNYNGVEKYIDFDLEHGTAYSPKYGSLEITAVSQSAIMQEPDIPNFASSTLSGHLLFTDNSGNHLGYNQGLFESEIPNATLVVPLEGVDDFPETYFLNDQIFKTELIGNGNGIATATIMRPDSLIEIDAGVTPGSKDELRVPQSGSSVEFISGAGTASLQLMIDKETDDDARIVTIGGFGVEVTKVVNVSFTQTRDEIKIFNSGGQKKVNLSIEQIGTNSGEFTPQQSVTIEASSSILLTPADWSKLSQTSVQVKHDVGNDGTIDYSETIYPRVQVSPLPGFSNPPTDPDSDGLYEDLNANNRKDFNDVVLMFNQMQWIAANEPVSAFDFNGNGRIDFNDIVKLFGEI